MEWSFEPQQWLYMTGSCNVGSQKQTRETAIDFGNFFREMQMDRGTIMEI
jgi:hypothetical protein